MNQNPQAPKPFYFIIGLFTLIVCAGLGVAMVVAIVKLIVFLWNL